jgi:hypothetical protein
MRPCTDIGALGHHCAISNLDFSIGVKIYLITDVTMVANFELPRIWNLD